MKQVLSDPLFWFGVGWIAAVLIIEAIRTFVGQERKKQSLKGVRT